MTCKRTLDFFLYGNGKKCRKLKISGKLPEYVQSQNSNCLHGGFWKNQDGGIRPFLKLEKSKIIVIVEKS